MHFSNGITIMVSFIVILEIVSAKYYYENSDSNDLEFRKPLTERKVEWFTSKHMVDMVNAGNDKVNFLKRRTTEFVNPGTDQFPCNSREFREEIKKMKEAAKCMPRDVIIHLKSTTQSTLIPSAVVVQRCDGMCTSHKCVPNQTRNREFKIKEIKNNRYTCTTIVVSEDVSCRCACAQTSENCNANQVYDPTTCRCNCNNDKDHRKCLEKKEIKKRDVYWDPETCKCMCKPQVCTTPSKWNANSCRCESPNKVIKKDAVVAASQQQTGKKRRPKLKIQPKTPE